MSIWILFYFSSVTQKEDYLYFDSSSELEEFLKDNPWYSKNMIGSPLEIRLVMRLR